MNAETSVHLAFKMLNRRQKCCGEARRIDRKKTGHKKAAAKFLRRGFHKWSEYRLEAGPVLGLAEDLGHATLHFQSAAIDFGIAGIGLVVCWVGDCSDIFAVFSFKLTNSLSGMLSTCQFDAKRGAAFGDRGFGASFSFPIALNLVSQRWCYGECSQKSGCYENMFHVFLPN